MDTYAGMVEIVTMWAIVKKTEYASVLNFGTSKVALCFYVNNNITF